MGIVHYSPVRNMIITAASRLKVDPALVEAIVAVESSFDPRAISPKGAIGLMQLMPQTASRYDVSDPFDPQENLTGSVEGVVQRPTEPEGSIVVLSWHEY